MKDITLAQLRQANIDRDQTPAFQKCLHWIPAQWYMALSGEAGELANILKKVDRGDFNLDSARHAIGEEIADILVYLDALARVLKIDTTEALRSKFNSDSIRWGSDVKL